MAEELDDKLVKVMAAPAAGNRIVYDAEIKGFGVRVTKAGAKAFILNYRAGGRERRYTIGSFPDWTTKAARDEAKILKRRIDKGEDPMAQRHEDRAAPTVASLADRFEEEHLSKRRPSTVTDYQSILRIYIRPQLGTTRVADVRHSDVEKLHRSVAKEAPVRANRVVSVLSKMMTLAMKWEMRGDNPVRGIDRTPEERRERFLSLAEIGRLADALTAHNEITSVNAIRLMMLTGARRGETLAARWSEFDLTAGVWIKPSAHTKTKKVHRVPLSAPALLLLTGMQADAPTDCPFLFPTTLNAPKGADGKKTYSHLLEVRKTWTSVSKTAGIPGVRVHDLRHTYASILASAGLSLPIIGALLGHTQAATTQRYAHLADDPLRAATERVGAVVSGAGKAGADVVPMRRGA
jgi:integrase